jgi:putative flippase GtrA
MLDTVTKLQDRLTPSRPDSTREELAQLLRYGLAGVANTLVGFSITATLDLGMQLHPAMANTAGYAVGIVMGFLLNRAFVFRSRRSAKAAGARYLIAVAIAFLTNQAVLAVVGHLLGKEPLARLLAQLSAMGFYTLVLFAFSRFWVFNK